MLWWHCSPSQAWVDIHNHRLLCELLSAIWSRFWVVLTSSHVLLWHYTRWMSTQTAAASFSVTVQYSAPSSSLSFESCQNFILNFDTGCRFQAKSKVLSASAGLFLAEMSDQLMMLFFCQWHQPPCMVGFPDSAASQIPVPTLRATLRSNCFLKVQRDEQTQRLVNEINQFLLRFSREILSGIDGKSGSWTLRDCPALPFFWLWHPQGVISTRTSDAQVVD